MKIILPLLLLSLTGCSITFRSIPIERPKTYPYHRAVKKKSVSATSDYTIVDAQWIAEYRALEAEHGSYRIPDDAKLESRNDGRFQVTKAQLRHFRDLSRTTISPTPSPTPLDETVVIPNTQY